GTTLGLMEAWHQQDLTKQALSDEAEQRDLAVRKATDAEANARRAKDQEQRAQESEFYYHGLLAMEQWRDYDSAEQLFLLASRSARTRVGLGDLDTQRFVRALCEFYGRTKKPEKAEPMLRELRDYQKQHD